MKDLFATLPRREQKERGPKAWLFFMLFHDTLQAVESKTPISWCPMVVRKPWPNFSLKVFFEAGAARSLSGWQRVDHRMSRQSRQKGLHDSKYAAVRPWKVEGLELLANHIKLKSGNVRKSISRS